MAEVGPLRRHMIEDITIRNLSPATQQCYIYAVCQIQPPLKWPLTEPIGTGGCACLPAVSHRAAAVVDRNSVSPRISSGEPLGQTDNRRAF